MRSCDELVREFDPLLSFSHCAVLLSIEIARVLILEIVEVFAEEFGCLFEDPGHLLGSCIDEDHLGHVDYVGLVRLLRQVALIDVEGLQVDRANKLGVRLAEFLHEAEDLLSIFLLLELLQIVEQLVQDLCEERSLADCGFAKEKIDFFA